MAALPNIINFRGNYDDLVQQVSHAQGLVVVDFSAVWCPPCKRLEEQLPAIAREAQKVTFLKVDIDQCRELTNHYQVNSVPHIRFLKAGHGNQIQELATVNGFDFQQIKAKIQQYGQ